MLKYLHGTVAAIAAIGSIALLCVSYGQDAPHTPPPIWNPQPKMMRYLSSLIRFHGYALQPPRGYAMQQTQKPGFAAVAWQGSAPRNQFAPGLLLTIGQAPYQSDKKLTPEQLLAASLNAQKRRYTDWTQTAFERGQINGLVFTRSYWTATQGQSKQKVRGVSYYAVDGRAAIVLTAQNLVPLGKSEGTKEGGTQPNAGGEDPDANAEDFMPADVDRLQLAEAALQTFRRNGGFKTPARPVTSSPTP